MSSYIWLLIQVYYSSSHLSNEGDDYIISSTYRLVAMDVMVVPGMNTITVSGKVRVNDMYMTHSLSLSHHLKITKSISQNTFQVVLLVQVCNNVIEKELCSITFGNYTKLVKFLKEWEWLDFLKYNIVITESDVVCLFVQSSLHCNILLLIVTVSWFDDCIRKLI